MSDDRNLLGGPALWPTPALYVSLGYAHLLRSWARRLPCEACGATRDPWMPLWQAEVAFRTAVLLVMGRNPWAPLKPGEQPVSLDGLAP